MKYQPRLNRYKGSNVEFYPESCRGYSYDWWLIVKSLKGRVLFNDYYYSSSTVKHQSKIRSLLDNLKITIDLEIPAPRGLQDLDASLDYMHSEIHNLNLDILKGHKGGDANKRRQKKITDYQSKITILKGLIENDN